MASLVLKVKSKSGQQVLTNLKTSNTILDLTKEISNLCNLNGNAINIRAGFPPKPINMDNSLLTLVDAGVNSGDTLIIEEKLQGLQLEDANSQVKSLPDDQFASQQNAKGVLLRKVVPSDNSCLFTSIGFVLSGKINLECGEFMRQVIAEHVRADPHEFNEAILGKKPDDYCQWILNSNSWGGAIELSILSKYYGVEIAVVDTLNGIINRFGEDQNYPHRVLLIFDGIHYDPLYLESVMTGDMQTMFSADDAEILADAHLLAEESKSSRQFTDVDKFSIKCNVCNVILKGQTEAQAHAKTTGHVSFGEV